MLNIVTMNTERKSIALVMRYNTRVAGRRQGVTDEMFLTNLDGHRGPVHHLAAPCIEPDVLRGGIPTFHTLLFRNNLLHLHHQPTHEQHKDGGDDDVAHDV